MWQEYLTFVKMGLSLFAMVGFIVMFFGGLIFCVDWYSRWTDKIETKKSQKRDFIVISSFVVSYFIFISPVVILAVDRLMKIIEEHK